MRVLGKILILPALYYFMIQNGSTLYVVLLLLLSSILLTSVPKGKEDNWFERKTFGWGKPTHWKGYLFTLWTLGAVLFVTIFVDSASHSVSDTLFVAFPFVSLIVAVYFVVVYVRSKRE